MARTVIRFEAPSDEPPAQVTSEIIWRLAVRLFRDHGSVEPTGPDDGRPRCDRCAQPWPCSGRRLAELGLKSATD